MSKSDDNGYSGLSCFGGVHGGGRAPVGRRRGRQAGLGPGKTVRTTEGVRIPGIMPAIKRRGPNPLVDRKC